MKPTFCPGCSRVIRLHHELYPNLVYCKACSRFWDINEVTIERLFEIIPGANLEHDFLIHVEPDDVIMDCDPQ